MSDVNSASQVRLTGYDFGSVPRSAGEHPDPQEESRPRLSLNAGMRMGVPYVTGIPEEVRDVYYSTPGGYSYEVDDGFVTSVLDYQYWVGLEFVPAENFSVYARGGNIEADPPYYALGADYSLSENLSLGYAYEHYPQHFRTALTYRERDDSSGEAYALLHVNPVFHEFHVTTPVNYEFGFGAGMQYVELDFVQAYDTYDSHRVHGSADKGTGYGIRIFGWGGTDYMRMGLSYNYASVEPEEYGGNVQYHSLQFSVDASLGLVK